MRNTPLFPLARLHVGSVPGPTYDISIGVEEIQTSRQQRPNRRILLNRSTPSCHRSRQQTCNRLILFAATHSILSSLKVSVVMAPASFLDRLTLHLALELLKDAAGIQAWLLSPAKEAANANDTTNRGNPDDRLVLYWRSKPQMGPDAPCFVDITFCMMNDDGCDVSPREETGQPQRSRRRLTFQVGYLRFESKEGATVAAADKDATTTSSTYIQNALFSTEDLQHHAQSLDLVLEQATPQTLAASLAQAMQSQWRICRDDDDDDKGKESLQCYYQELDQWGSLGGSGGISSSCLDATATRLLLQNLKSFEDHQSHKKVVTQVNRQACEALLEQWMDSAPSTNNRETESKTATSVAQATTQVKPAKKKATAGFRQLPKKRSRKSSGLKIRALD